MSHQSTLVLMNILNEHFRTTLVYMYDMYVTNVGFKYGYYIKNRGSHFNIHILGTGVVNPIAGGDMTFTILKIYSLYAKLEKL